MAPISALALISLLIMHETNRAWNKYVSQIYLTRHIMPRQSLIARLDMEVSSWRISTSGVKCFSEQRKREREREREREKWIGINQKSSHKTLMNNRFLMISLRWSCGKSLYWCKIEFNLVLYWFLTSNSKLELVGAILSQVIKMH